MLHFWLSIHVRSAGAHGSNTERVRVTVEDSPLRGPTATYDTSQGADVEVLVKLAGGALTMVTGMVPDTESVA